MNVDALVRRCPLAWGVRSLMNHVRCYASCISIKAKCSLFVSKKEWEKVEADKRQKRLALLQAKAKVAHLRLEVTKTKALKWSYADRDYAILSLQDCAKEQAEGSSAPGGTGLPVLQTPPLSEPLANLGQLQANSFNPSFNFSPSFPAYFNYSALELTFSSLVVSSKNHVLVTCSLLDFLQVPKCCGSLAIPAT